MKKTLMYMAILSVVFTAAMLYRSYTVDPIADQAYAEIYGTEE